MRRLTGELAEARAEQAELRRRLAAFEMIAAAAAAPPEPSPPVPPELAAAARELHATEVPVRLHVAGSDVVAVVSGAGDPRQWWAAVWRLAAPEAP